MIDPTNNATQQLPSEPVSRGRGRPSTGQALSNAERQKAYRLRQKQLCNDKSENGLSVQVELLQRLLSESEEERVRLTAELNFQKGQIIVLDKQNERLNVWFGNAYVELKKLGFTDFNALYDV
ncbi:hypothetical protein [Pseudomonas sp. NPDC079086]|uniref:hypothetical protein n=1 Tax=unclassified Pseudomonas TaxID=196821 RepID=UPI0037CC5BDF